MKKSDLIPLSLLISAILFIFGSLNTHIITTEMQQGLGDYYTHLMLAQQWQQTGILEVPHFLFHSLVIVIHWLIPALSLSNTGVVVDMMSYLLLGVGLYYYFLHRLEWGLNHHLLAGITSTLLVLAVLLVNAVSVLVVVDHHFYLGYIALNTYHNPTLIVLKPLAFLLFFQYIVPFCDKDKSNHTTFTYVTAGFLTVLATLAKPSFTICLLPVLFIWLCKSYLFRQPVPTKYIILSIVFPAISILGIQFVFTYGTSNQITFAPFEVLHYYSDFLLPKFFLSILFPFSVLLCYYSQVKQKITLQLAWCLFAVGVFYTYFLAEEGLRKYHANFTWSGQITLFILFIASVAFLLEQWATVDKCTRRFLFCTVILGLHLVFGIAWYVAEMWFYQNLW